MNWSSFDWLVFIALISGVVGTVYLIRRFCTSPRTRWLVTSLVLVAFGLLYIELAVGILGSPVAGS